MNNNDVIPLLSEHHSSMMKLHDHLFLKSYLNGNEIVEGLSENTIVLGVVDKNSNLLGYLYAEANPEF